VDCRVYRAARASAGVLVPELARQERLPCLGAEGEKRHAPRNERGRQLRRPLT
jgi:hypothetical protein